MSDLTPVTRTENFLARIAGEEAPELEPITRIEHFLQEIIDNESLTPEQIAEGAGAWLDDNLATPSTPPIDSSLSVANAAADAKATGDAIETNESAIDTVLSYEEVPVTMVGRKVINITQKLIKDAGSSFYVSNAITVAAGELYKITCEGIGNAAAYALGADGVISEVYPESYTTGSQMHYVSDKLIKIPNGVNELYISDTTSGEVTQYSVNKVIKSDPVLYTVQSKTAEEKKTARTNIDGVGMSEFSDVADENYTPYSITTTQNKIVNSHGVVTNYADHSEYIVSNQLDVSAVDKVRVSGRANFNNSICVFYDDADNVVSIPLKSATGTSTITTYTNEIVAVPNGASYMVIASITTEPTAAYLAGYTPKKVFDGLKWAAVGDSLTEVNSRTTMHYHDYIANETGINVVNMGLSGSGYKRKEDTNNAFYQRVLNIPSNSDVVTIFGSGNDQTYYADSMGTATDTGTETLGGCINTTIDNIYSVLPTVQLGIIAPCPWQSYNPVNHNNGMAQYTELLREICYNRSIPFLDLYHESNLRPWDATFRTLAYSKDDGGGTHPDETGHKLLAGRIRVFLNSLIGSY